MTHWSIGTGYSVMREIRVRTNTAVVLVTMLPLLAGCLDSKEDNVDSSALAPPGSNSAPVISGTPGSSVKTDELYSFTPTASDPDGDTLTFTIQNKPVWAAFNSSTGQLAGTPIAGNEGPYSNILIKVSDGQLSASLSSFSVSVNQVSLGSATLSWTPPTQNSDGTALTDLAGYIIHYGNASGNYQTSIQIDNPGIAIYVVENLTPNTYYFVLTAINSSGVESRFSNEVSEQIL